MYRKLAALICTLVVTAQLALAQSGPGGIGSNLSTSDSLILWLRADSLVTLNGSSQVTGWGDISGNDNDFTSSSGFTVNSAGLNNRPTIDMSETSNGLLSGPNTGSILGNSSGAPANAGDIFVVFEQAAGNSGYAIQFPRNNSTSSFLTFVSRGGDDGNPVDGGEPNDVEVFYRDGTPAWGVVSSEGTALDNGFTDGAFHVLRFGVDPIGDSVYMFSMDSFVESITSADPSYEGSTGNGPVRIGSSGASQDYNGEMAEIIVFGDVINEAQFIVLQNYFNARYGLTTSNDFYAGNFDGTEYREDVIGIGNEGTSSHLSTSGGGGGLYLEGTLGAGSTLFDEDEWIFAGHDGGLTETTFADVPDADVVRIERIWKLEKTNGGPNPGVDIIMSFDLSEMGLSNVAGPTLYKRTASSGDFTNLGLTPTVNGDVISFNVSDANTADGTQFFTLGFTASVPGGVSDDLVLWLKSDNGVETSGNSVDSWRDQTQNGNDATDPSALSDFVSNAYNFNPGLSFNSDPTSLEGAITTTNSNLSIFAVFEDTSSTNGGAIFELNSGQSHPLYDNSYAGGAAFTSTITKNSLSIFTIDHPAGTTADLFLNGSVFETSYTTTGNSAAGTYNYTLGDDDDGGNTFSGSLNELIVFDHDLDAGEIEQIESYLGIKYGVSLSHDYVSSTSTVVFDVDNSAVNDGYETHIAAIGSDFVSGLAQKISRNQNDSLVIALEEDYTSSNDSRSTNLEDGSFFFVSSNGSDLTTSSDGENSFLDRVWKVNETGTVGNVFVGFPINTFLFDSILVSTDPTFSSGVTRVAISTSNGYNSVSYDFNDGDYFTFSIDQGLQAENTNLLLWLKADSGVTTNGSVVTNWSDLSSYGNDADNDDSEFDNEANLNTLTEEAVSWGSNVFNFNPGVTFNSDVRPITGSVTTTGGFTFFIVGIETDNGSTNNSWFDTYLSGSGAAGSNRTYLFESLYAGGADFSTPLLDDERVIYSVSHPEGTTVDIFQNGADFETSYGVTATMDNEAGTYHYVIGDDATGGNDIQGQISEFIIFQGEVDGIQRKGIESYLAIKYGISLQNDFTTPDGLLLFDYNGTINDGFENYIAALAREDIIGLDQKVSQNQSGSLIISMAEDFESENADRTSAFSDQQYFFISSNLGSVGSDSSYRGFTGNRIGRKWKVNETNDPGAVFVALNDGVASQLNVMLVSSDSSLTSPEEVELIQSGGYYYANYDFQDGDYFTFAYSISPGGYYDGLKLWLRADVGINEIGGDISAWSDQSGNGNDATTPATDPIYQSAVTNFNPAANFSSSGTRVQGTVELGSDSLTVFIIAVDSSGAASGNVIFELDDSSTPLTFTDGSYGNVAFGQDITKDTMQMLSLVQPEGSGPADIYKDGSIFEGGISPDPVQAGTYDYALGENVDGGNGFTGSIAEFIVYDSALSDAQREMVESYLAVKYALPINHDVVSSLGNVVLDASGSAGYLNGLTALAYDSRTLLDQQVAKSVYDSVYIATSEDFATENGSRSNSFGDEQYLVITNDGGNYAFNSDYRTGSNNRLDRIWKVHELNNPGIIYLALPNSGIFTGISSILVSDDPSFSSGVSEKSLTDNGAFLTVPLDFSDGQYFTFTTDAPASGVWYSYLSGNWSDPANWTQDGAISALYVNPLNEIPSENDTVVIKSGRTMTVDFSGICVEKIEIIGNLDVGTTSGHMFNNIEGSGVMRLAGAAGLDNYPTGVDTLFYDTQEGGRVEYYGSGLSLNQRRSYNDLLVDLTATSDEIVLLDSIYVYGNMTINSGEFKFNSNSGQDTTLAEVFGDVLIESQGSFSVGLSNTRHEFNLHGDFTNLGDASFTNRSVQDQSNEATNGMVDVNFVSDDQDQVVDLQGPTDFYRIVIDKGVDKTYRVTLSIDDPADFRLLGPVNYGHGQTSQLNPATDQNLNAIGLYYGTLVIGNNINLGTLNNGGNYNISAGSRIILNGGSVEKDAGTAIVVYGDLEINSGSVSADIASGITIRDDGTLTVVGGTLITRQIRTSVLGVQNQGGYIQTGGVVTVTGGNVQDDYYPFNLTYSGNVFQMTGGTLNISGSNYLAAGSPVTGGALFINCDTENINVTGGTINIDSDTDNEVRISSRAPFYNLTLSKSSPTGGDFLFSGGSSGPNGDDEVIPDLPITILNDFTLDNGDGNGTVLNPSGNDLNITGSLIMEDGSSADFTNMTVTFEGAGSSNLDLQISEKLTLDSLQINKNLGVVDVIITNGQDTAIQVNHYLSIENGNLNPRTHHIKTTGDINLGDTLGKSSSTGRLFIVGSSAQTIYSDGGMIYDIEVDSANGLYLQGDLVVDTLTLDNGIFYINESKLTALKQVQTNSTFSNSVMIQTSGNASDGGLEYFVDASTTDPDPLTYPIGIDTAVSGYTPVSLDLSNVTLADDGYVVISLANTELQTTNLGGGNILSYYWRVNHSGFSSLPTAEYAFTYSDSDDDAMDEGNYVPGKVLDEIPFTRSAEMQSNINTGSNVITFDNDGGGGFTLENANYSAGVPGRFTGNVEIYYSYAPDGNWVNFETSGNWSTVSHTDPTNTGNYPQAGDVAIIGSTRSGGGTGRIQVTGTNNVDITIAALVFNSQAGGTALNVTDMSRLRVRRGSTLTVGTVSGTGEMVQDIGNAAQTATIVGDFGDFLDYSDNGWFFWFQSAANVSISDRFEYPIFRTFGADGSLSFTQDVTAHGVVIDSDTELRVTTNYTIDSLVQIGSNSSGNISFRNAGSNLTFECGSIFFSNDADNSITVVNSGSDVHRLIVNGDIDLNQGTEFNLTSVSGTQVELEFSGSGEHTLSNNSVPTPELYRLIVNKGTDTTSTITIDTDFNLAGVTTSIPQAVELQNGKLILDNASINIELADNSDFTIPASAGLQVTSGTVTSTDASIILDGLLRIDGGTATLNNTDVVYSSTGSALMDISSGTLQVGGQVRRTTTSTTGILKYRQTGGDVDIAVDGAGTNSRAAFEVLNNGSEFTLTGGSFNIVRGVTGDANESLELDPETYDLTGSTISIFENLGSNYGSNFFNVKTTIPLENLTIANSIDLPDVNLYTLPLVVDNLIINANQAFRANGFDVTITGDITNNGSYTNSSAETILANTGSQSLSGSGTWVIYDLRKNGSGTTTSSVDLSLLNDLYLTSGTLNISTNSISLQNDAYIQSTLSNSGGNGLIFNGTTSQELYGLSNNSIDIGTITIENTAGIEIPDGNGYDFNITQNLQLDGGVFNIGGSLVTLARGATLTELTPFGSNNMVQTNSSFTDNGLKQEFHTVASDTSILFPIGESKYTPVQFDFDAGTTQGAIRIRPANERHPTIINDTEPDGFQLTDVDNVLQYHWIVVAEDITNATGEITFTYDEDDAFALSTDYDTSHYIPARLLSNGVTWDKLDPTAFRGDTLVFQFPLSNATSAEITGDYTAGVGSSNGLDNDIEGAIPDEIAEYISIIGGTGDYTITGNWDPQGSSPVVTNGVGPLGARITVSSGDTVNLNVSNIRLYATVINSGGVIKVPSGITGVRLGIVSGSGTIILENNELLPTGEYNDFFTCSGGALVYTGTGGYNVLSGISQVRKVTFDGTGTRILPNNALTVCDTLLITGPTVNFNTGQTFIIGNAATDNLQLGSGTLTLTSSSALDITGDLLIGGGSFTGSTGTSISITDDLNFSGGTLNWNGSNVVLDGTTEQILDGNFTGTGSFDNLTINNSSSTGITVNSGDVRVDGVLTMTDGYINTTGAETWTISSTGSYTGASTASYFRGPLTKVSVAASSTYIFPIGRSNRYAPLSIIDVGTGSDTWTAEYFTSTGVYNNNTFDPDDPGSGKNALLAVRNTDRWEVTSAGSNTARIRLTYGGHSNLPDDASTRVVWWDGTTDNRWENRGGIVNGTAASGTVTSEDAISFSTQQFALGIAPEDPLPIEMVYFEGRFFAEKVDLYWQTAIEINNDRFYVERSVNGEDFEEVGSVDGHGSTSEPHDYQFTDDQPFGINSYYRLRQVDFDGNFEYSETILIQIQRDELEFNVSLFPNPVDGNTINLSTNGLEFEEVFTVTIVDISGKLQLLQTLTNTQSVHQIQLPPGMKPGVYSMVVQFVDKTRNFKLLLTSATN